VSDGSCIAKTKLCDFKHDCSDSSDEIPEHCTNSNLCNADQYQCKAYGVSIHKSKLQDGYSDCFDGEDEANRTVLMFSILFTILACLFIVGINFVLFQN